MKPQMLILMGGPGAGKGTLSEMLRARGDYNYIEMGQILRDSARNDAELARFLATGNLLSDEMICDIYYPSVKDGVDTLTDGFPRTLGQAKCLVDAYADKFRIRVVFIEVPQDVIVARIAKRHALGGGRSDDADPVVVKNRIDNFNKITMPAVEYLRTAPGVEFYEIDGRGTPDENLAEALAALKE